MCQDLLRGLEIMDSLSIIITTCDSFSDLWSNNIFLLNKFWPNHPECFVVSDKNNDKGEMIFKNFAYFSSDYSFRLLNLLKTIKADYILLTLDDYLISSFVDVNRINDLVSFMKNNGLSYIRLYNRTKTKGWINKEKRIHLLPLKKDAYEVNLYPSLWRKDDLIKIITHDENIWKFEVRLTRRCRENNYKCAWVSNKKVFEFVDTIRKGKYLRSAYRFLKKNDLYISSRGIRTAEETLHLSLRTLISRYTPDVIKRRIKRKRKNKYYSEFSETDD